MIIDWTTGSVNELGVFVGGVHAAAVGVGVAPSAQVRPAVSEPRRGRVELPEIGPVEGEGVVVLPALRVRGYGTVAAHLEGRAVVMLGGLACGGLAQLQAAHAVELLREPVVAEVAGLPSQASMRATWLVRGTGRVRVSRARLHREDEDVMVALDE